MKILTYVLTLICLILFGFSLLFPDFYNNNHLIWLSIGCGFIGAAQISWLYKKI
jgi:hypothetical protein